MTTAIDILMHVSQVNKLNVTEPIKVPSNEALSVDGVRHICRSGLSVMPKQSFTFNNTLPSQRGMEKIDMMLWNCPKCGKTYYSVDKDTVMFQ